MSEPRHSAAIAAPDKQNLRAPGVRGGIDVYAMAALTGGHFAVDLVSGSVPAMIPFLRERFHLSYALAAMLLLAVTLSSSLTQPLFGIYSDRRRALWLMPCGTLLAALGIGAAAVVPTFSLALALAVVGGLGMAAFHPEGAKCASYASGDRRASGMSLFGFGGNAGVALGALVTGQLVILLGARGGVLAMTPVLAAAFILAGLMPRFAGPARTTLAGAVGGGASDDQPKAMRSLAIVIALRSIPWYTLLAFTPLWLAALGHSKADGNRVLFVMLLAGAVGTPLIGLLADRLGLRRVLTITQMLITPLMVVFIYIGGLTGVFALMLLAVCVVGTFGVTTVLSQLYLPKHLGVAAGLSVGLNVGIGGLVAVGLGAIADAVDLKVALTVSAIPPLLGVLYCLRLPLPARP